MLINIDEEILALVKIKDERCETFINSLLLSSMAQRFYGAHPIVDKYIDDLKRKYFRKMIQEALGRD